MLVVGGRGYNVDEITPIGQCNNHGFPNGGCGSSGTGGGGSSHIISEAHGFAGVVVGAGGGGGATYNSGGGGGGTCDGRVGTGGDAFAQTTPGNAGTDGGGGGGSSSASTPGSGSCGGGNGGKGVSGQNANGAGGPVTADVYGGGGGGAASFKYGCNVTLENAESSSAVGLARLPPQYASRTPGASQTDGAIIVEDALSGNVIAAYFEHGSYSLRPTTLTSAFLDGFLQRHINAGVDCRLGGGVYNVTTGACMADMEGQGDGGGDVPTSKSARSATAELVVEIVQCRDAGGVFNTTTNSCDLGTVPDADADPCAHHRASLAPDEASSSYVGLDGSGAFLLCPPATKPMVRIGGRLESGVISELRGEIASLRSELALALRALNGTASGGGV